MPLSDFLASPRPDGMSERQHGRAIETLSGGRPFYDRVGGNLFLSCPLDKDKPEVFQFRRLSFEAGVEEAERWFPLLAEHLLLCLEGLKQSSLNVSEGVPPYCFQTIRHECVHAKDPFALMCVEESLEADRHIDSFHSVLARKIGNGTEWLGTGGAVSWFLLREADPPRLKALFSQAGRNVRNAMVPKAASVRIRVAFVSPGMDRDEVFALMDTVRTVGDAVGAVFLTSFDCANLLDRLGWSDPSAWAGARQRIVARGGGGKVTYAAYASPVSGRPEEGELKGIEVIRAGPSGFFFVEGFPSGACPPHDSWISRLVSSLRRCGGAAANIGFASIALLPAGFRDLFVAVIGAFLHARLLGAGRNAIFDSTTLNVLGDEYFGWGDMGRASESYSAGLRMDPSNAKLMNSLGVCLAGRGFKKRALDLFSRAAGADPKDFMAHYNLGGIHLETGRIDLAEQALRVAHGLQPDAVPVVLRLAEILIKAGKDEEAESCLLGFDSPPGRDRPASWYKLLGRSLYTRADRWQDAKMALQAALRLNPCDDEALSLLALGFVELEKDAETASRLYRSISRSWLANGRKNPVMRRIEKGLGLKQSQK